MLLDLRNMNSGFLEVRVGQIHVPKLLGLKKVSI
jgi:hypothetical protein